MAEDAEHQPVLVLDAPPDNFTAEHEALDAAPAYADGPTEGPGPQAGEDVAPLDTAEAHADELPSGSGGGEVDSSAASDRMAQPEARQDRERDSSRPKDGGSRGRTEERGRSSGGGGGGYGGGGRNVQRQDDDWDCPSCKEMNFSYRTECFRCRAARPEGMGAAPGSRRGYASDVSYRNNDRAMPRPGPGDRRQGDWDCRCGNYNFARRDTCNKCGSSKSEGSSGGGGGGGGGYGAYDSGYQTGYQAYPAYGGGGGYSAYGSAAPYSAAPGGGGGGYSAAGQSYGGYGGYYSAYGSAAPYSAAPGGGGGAGSFGGYGSASSGAGGGGYSAAGQSYGGYGGAASSSSSHRGGGGGGGYQGGGGGGYGGRQRSRSRERGGGAAPRSY